ncbi:MAG: hypothetical protein ABIY56_08870 [Dokdonella sp.]
MVIDTSLPLALYKANLELAMHISELMQESRQRWLTLETDGAGSAVDEARHSAEVATGTTDWNAVMSLPGETFFQTLRQGVGGYQALLETAIGNQTEFSGGLRGAFTVWREQCARALDENGGTLPFASSFDEFLKPFRNLAVTPPDTVKATRARQKGHS